MTSPYLDQPLLPLAVALPRMLEKIEADLGDETGAPNFGTVPSGIARDWMRSAILEAPQGRPLDQAYAEAIKRRADTDGGPGPSRPDWFARA